MNVKTKAFDYTEALKSESKKYKICSVVLFCIGIGLFQGFFMMVSILFRLPFTFSEYGIFSRSVAVFFIIIMIINGLIFIIIMRTLGFICRWQRCLLLVKENFRYFYFIDTVQNGFAIANAIYLSIYVWFYF